LLVEVDDLERVNDEIVGDESLEHLLFFPNVDVFFFFFLVIHFNFN